MSSRIRQAESAQYRSPPLEFQVGDTVDVGVRIREGDKERVQTFTGRVIRRRGGGLSETFTVRRIVMGEGVERTFPLHSPRISAVKIISRGVVRRSRLYYMRDRVGKATRLRETRAEDGVLHGSEGTKGAKAAKEAAAAAAEGASS
jgi:large subunit ribosomal protein L19